MIQHRFRIALCWLIPCATGIFMARIQGHSAITVIVVIVCPLIYGALFPQERKS